jgi:hypothetical protein
MPPPKSGPQRPLGAVLGVAATKTRPASQLAQISVPGAVHAMPAAATPLAQVHAGTTSAPVLPVVGATATW